MRPVSFPRHLEARYSHGARQRPYSLRRRVRRRPSFLPRAFPPRELASQRALPREWSAAKRVHCSLCRASFPRRGRLAALHRGVLLPAPGRAFRRSLCRLRTSASSSRGSNSDPGRCPSAARVRGLRSSPPAGAAPAGVAFRAIPAHSSCSVVQASLEDALSRARRCGI